MSLKELITIFITYINTLNCQFLTQCIENLNLLVMPCFLHGMYKVHHKPFLFNIIFSIISCNKTLEKHDINQITK